MNKIDIKILTEPYYNIKTKTFSIQSSVYEFYYDGEENDYTNNSYNDDETGDKSEFLEKELQSAISDSLRKNKIEILSETFEYNASIEIPVNPESIVFLSNYLSLVGIGSVETYYKMLSQRIADNEDVNPEKKFYRASYFSQNRESNRLDSIRGVFIEEEWNELLLEISSISEDVKNFSYIKKYTFNKVRNFKDFRND
jgi:hypothetical protein